MVPTYTLAFEIIVSSAQRSCHRAFGDGGGSNAANVWPLKVKTKPKTGQISKILFSLFVCREMFTVE